MYTAHCVTRNGTVAPLQTWYFPSSFLSLGSPCGFHSRKYDHQPSREAWVKIFKRALLIFLIGLALNAFHFTTIRWDPCASWVYCNELQSLSGRCNHLHCSTTEIPALGRCGHFVGLLGTIEIFGWRRSICAETNIGRHIDLALLGEAHLYKGFGMPFDPEGLVSSIPAIGTVILGYLLGSYIDRSRLEHRLLRQSLFLE